MKSLVLVFFNHGCLGDPQSSENQIPITRFWEFVIIWLINKFEYDGSLSISSHNLSNIRDSYIQT